MVFAPVCTARITIQTWGSHASIWGDWVPRTGNTLILRQSNLQRNMCLHVPHKTQVKQMSQQDGWDHTCVSSIILEIISCNNSQHLFFVVFLNAITFWHYRLPAAKSARSTFPLFWFLSVCHTYRSYPHLYSNLSNKRTDNFTELCAKNLDRCFVNIFG